MMTVEIFSRVNYWDLREMINEWLSENKWRYNSISIQYSTSSVGQNHVQYSAMIVCE